MSLRVLIILALKAKVAAEIFNRCRRSSNFLPCVKRLGQAIQVLDVQLRLRKCLPSIGIIRSDRDDSSTQLDDRGFIASFLRLGKLRVQSRNIAACSAQRTRRAQD